MIIPLLLGAGAFYLGGRYRFSKRNCGRRNPLHSERWGDSSVVVSGGSVRYIASAAGKYVTWKMIGANAALITASHGATFVIADQCTVTDKKLYGPFKAFDPTTNNNVERIYVLCLPKGIKNPVTITEPMTQTSATVPGHLYFQDAYLRLAPVPVCSADGEGRTICVDPSGLTAEG